MKIDDIVKLDDYGVLHIELQNLDSFIGVEELIDLHTIYGEIAYQFKLLSNYSANKANAGSSRSKSEVDKALKDEAKCDYIYNNSLASWMKGW